MTYDLIIIGSGPAGYVAAVRAAQVGLKVALVEKASLGGLCLNWGCIPMKSLLESAKLHARMMEAQAWGIDGVATDQLRFNWQGAIGRVQRVVQQLQSNIDALLKKHAVTRVEGEASIPTAGRVEVDGRSLQTKSILIATGSRAPKLGIDVPEEKVVTLKELMAMESLPSHFAIYGEGGHGAEIAQLLAMLGHSVSLLCPSERLVEELDPELERALLERLRQKGVRVELSAKVKSFEHGTLQTRKERYKADLVINACTREAVIPENGLGLRLQDGALPTDDHLRCAAKGIYAAGDVTGKSHLAHVASAQGLYVVDQLMGHSKPFDPGLYPLNLYLDLEIAQIGQTTPQLKAAGIPYKVTRHPLQSNAKAWIEGYPEGFLRILSNPIMGDVLGVQIMALHATDMISEAATLMQMEGTLFELARTLHAHPTVSEVFLEAAREGIE